VSKIDLKKNFKQLYTASEKEIAIVDVPSLHFLMAEGKGDPNTVPAFQHAVETLFRLSYAIKFILKKTQSLDYVVMPLEGLWWADDPIAFAEGRKDDWQWTLMIQQPGFVTRENVAAALEQTNHKKNTPPLYDTTYKRFAEGQSAQILHVGPYGDEAPIIARLHRFIKEKGYHFCGKHHEIYLSDPRRTAPEKLKTILRQPITLEAQR